LCICEIKAKQIETFLHFHAQHFPPRSSAVHIPFLLFLLEKKVFFF
jgi:hypothetical protein